MTPSIQTTVHDRQIIVPVPDEIADGTRVEVVVYPILSQIGIEESQWKNDEAAIKDWHEWLETVEPIDFAPPSRFDEDFIKHNLDAVRKQMLGDQS